MRSRFSLGRIACIRRRDFLVRLVALGVPGQQRMRALFRSGCCESWRYLFACRADDFFGTNAPGRSPGVLSLLRPDTWDMRICAHHRPPRSLRHFRRQQLKSLVCIH
jgi:hypothetical protein